ncbi:MAG TPA: L-threonylcarbamoyladenylate synthase [Patescibacteria group bacterium]|nr:L-threonylcarbamoyladenylate synthase [Patescibacteria group bacterium]
MQDKLVSPTKAIAILKAGGIGVIPTDTVYGVVACAKDQKAVARLYTLKKRDHKPGSIVAADAEQLIDLGLNKDHIQAVRHLWPNPLSLVIPTADELFYLHQGLDSLPARVPKDAQFQILLQQTGPLATSSANRPGEPTATNIQEAWNYFKDSIDFYVDAGDLSGREPSTIVRIANDNHTIEILRQGAFNFE